MMQNLALFFWKTAAVEVALLLFLAKSGSAATFKIAIVHLSFSAQAPNNSSTTPATLRIQC